MIKLPKTKWENDSKFVIHLKNMSLGSYILDM